MKLLIGNDNNNDNNDELYNNTAFCDIQHIESEPPFSRRHFEMHFLEWKCLNFV